MLQPQHASVTAALTDPWFWMGLSTGGETEVQSTTSGTGVICGVWGAGKECLCVESCSCIHGSIHCARGVFVDGASLHNSATCCWESHFRTSFDNDNQLDSGFRVLACPHVLLAAG